MVTIIIIKPNEMDTRFRYWFHERAQNHCLLRTRIEVKHDYKFKQTKVRQGAVGCQLLNTDDTEV